MADKNQDKNQSKNRAEQAEEHDESVLNPEIKNESDLSKKERRLIEKEKLKGMGPKKKLEYIWMYYKPAIFGVIFIPARGKAFSGTENGFVAYKTHLAIFWRKSKSVTDGLGVAWNGKPYVHQPVFTPLPLAARYSATK